MIRKIASDKWKHFFAGIALGAGLQAVFIYFLPSRLVVTVGLSVVLVLLISYGVELASKITRKGHYDLIDALASILGGLIGIALILFIEMYFFAIPESY